MKKLVLTAAAVLVFGFINAQEQTAKGKLLVEVNTGFGLGGKEGAGLGSTQIGFASIDGTSVYNFGAEGGYFVADNLALKVGLGYGGFSPKEGDGASGLAYKVGAKYYVSGMIPLEVSYNGTSSSPSVEGQKNPSYVGIQAGYAVFLGDMVSLEPGIRYNYALLNKEDGGLSALQFNIGFVMHF